MKSSGIGGQAVLEGVMMRNKSEYAVAVRKPDGEIEVKTEKCKSNADRSLFFRLPLVRGVVAFVDSLVLGMKTLTYSASFYEEEESTDTASGKKQRVSKKKEKEKAVKKEISEEEKAAKQEQKEQIEMILTVILAVILAVAVFMVLPFGLSLLLNRFVKSGTLLALIEGVIRIILFMGYVYAISFMEDIHRVFMYHGAEHKTINCIENCQDLTVANVRRQSRHHRRCGTSFLFIVMFISIIFFMFLHFDNLWLRLLSRIILVPVVAGVSYEFIRLAGNSDSKVVAVLSKPGMMLQRMTTREPDAAMIEVAIASVEAVFDWKEYQSRLIAMEKSQERKKQAEQKEKRAGTSTEKKAFAKPKRERATKKTRAQMAEELRMREAAYAKRANERARQIKERQIREEEVTRKAEEAAKRHARREAMAKTQEMEEDDLEALDHFFDQDKGTKETKPSVDVTTELPERHRTETSSKSGNKEEKKDLREAKKDE